jgi:signal transduction histidine kinase
MNRRARLVLLLAACLCTSGRGVLAQDIKNILILHFERPQLPANVIASRVFEQVFARQPHQFFDEYLDETRLGSDYSPIAVALQGKYAHERIDLVITIGPQVFTFLLRYGDRLWPSIPKVSCLVDLPEAPHDLPRGVHIIGSSIAFSPTIDLARKLQPDLQHIFFIEGGSKQETGRVHMAQSEFKHYPGPIDFTYLDNLPWTQLLQRVTHLPPHSAIFFTTYFSDPTGQPFTSPQACKAVAAVSNVPVYGPFDTLLDHCIVGGRIFSIEDAARATGLLGLAILRGQVSPDAPFEEDIGDKTVVDERVLDRWKIPESLVPAGVIIVNREPSAWHKYGPYVIVFGCLALLESVFILILLIERERRRHADRAVHRMTQRLINASEEERSHIARELHDNVGQRLSILSFQLGSLASGTSAPAVDVSEPLDALKALISDVHKLSHRLHSSKLEYLGLKSAMTELCQQLAQAHNVRIDLDADQIPASLSPPTALCLYRVAQEALTNAIRHSGANIMKVCFRCTEKNIVMEISDSGRGFDLSSTPSGLGLTAMQERVRILDGRLNILSKLSSGTTITATLPLSVTPELADDSHEIAWPEDKLGSYEQPLKVDP